MVQVYVVDYGRSSLYMRYLDPVTGRYFTRSTGERLRKRAEKVAAKWEHDLNAGRETPSICSEWETFRDKYRYSHVTSLAVKTQKKITCVLNSFEEIADVKRLSQITTSTIGDWQAALRRRGRSESTIKNYTAQLRAALQWACDNRLIGQMPKMPRVHRARGGRMMRGRPIAEEEFSLMLAAVESEVGAKQSPAWAFLLRGLWFSGLRLGEAAAFSWTAGESHISVDLSGEYPMLLVPGAAEKANTDRLLPITPDFAEHLLTVPASERTGLVYKGLERRPSRARGGRSHMRLEWLSKTIAKIGEKSGVIVDEARQRTATAHDLRRSFGARWARLVMPQVLMELMRHESIETTMRYYVGRNAQETAATVWKAASAGVGNSFGNTLS